VRYLLLFLLTTTALSEPWYQKHPPLTHQETWNSIGETAFYGSAIPTSAYLTWNKIKPTHRNQTRVNRIIICHMASLALTVAVLRGKALHDDDARYINPAMFTFVSLPVNLIVDIWRVQRWKVKVARGIKENT
jgi:hypothetical protein